MPKFDKPITLSPETAAFLYPILLNAQQELTRGVALAKVILALSDVMIDGNMIDLETAEEVKAILPTAQDDVAESEFKLLRLTIIIEEMYPK